MQPETSGNPTEAQLMSVREAAAKPASERQPSSWMDLIYYLLAGFGIYYVASAALSLVTQMGTLPDTFARVVLNVVILTGAVYLVGVRRGKISWSEIGFLPAVWTPHWLLLAIGIPLILMPVRGGIGLLAQYLLSGGIESMQGRMDVLAPGFQFSWSYFGLSVLGMGVIVPIAEELYFRGLLHSWFKSRFGYWPRIFLSSLIFGLAHYDAVGVTVSSFIMGLANAVAFEKSKSIWLPIAFHIVTNTFAVIMLNLLMVLSEYLAL